MYDGSFLCGEAAAGLTRGSWRLAASGTKLVFTYAGTAGEYEQTVEELSEATLIVSYATGLTSGLQVRNTYRRQ